MQISLCKRGMKEFDASAFSTKEEREMLYAITKLDVSYNSLALVKGMQCLSNLTALDISYNKVKSLTGLPLKLRRLNASHNELKYVDGLTPLSQLEWIDVSFNELVSLGGLPGTQGLRHVNACNNRIGTLKGIELCTGVHELLVTHNLLRKVDDLIPLRYLRAIRQLSVTENPVTANPRNFAAIRLLVPTIQHLEGANAASATVSAMNHNASSVAGAVDGSAYTGAPYYHQLNASKTSANGRARSPQAGGGTNSRTVTPNTSSIGNVSSVKTLSPTRGRTATPASGTEPYRRVQSASSADQSSSLYQSLLKSLDPSKAQRASAAFTSTRGTERASSADPAKSNASPRRGLTFLSATGPHAGSTATSTTAKHRPYVGPQQIFNAADNGKSVQDSSTASISAQRLLEERLAELERDLKEARKNASEAQRDADNYKLQVKQLKETVERQAKVNAMLSDANRQLSIEASRLSVGAPKVSIPMSLQAATNNGPVRRPSLGASAAASAASLRSGRSPSHDRVSFDDPTADSGARTATPENTQRTSPSGGTPRLNSPKSTGISSYAAKQTVRNNSPSSQTGARGSISGGGKKSRRADMSPKRGSMTSDVRELIPQTGQPSFVMPASVASKDRSHNNNQSFGKNVSFGGSQFYSPPQHYF